MKNSKIMEIGDTDEKVTRRRVEKGDTTVEIECIEVENGFILHITKTGYEGSGENKDYFHKRQSYISKKNPLDGFEEEKSIKEEIADALSNISL